MKVTASTLKKVAGVIWLGIGLMLVTRGLLMIFGKADASAWARTLAILLGLVLGAGKGKFALSKAAARNMKRIDALPSPRIWNVFAPKFAILIALMIGLGMGLRAAAARGWLGGFTGVGGIYVGIGMGLIVSSAAYLLKPRPPMSTRTDTKPVDPPRKNGLMLMNLGTPDAPETAAVRRYLREFLSDPRVVEVPRPLWLTLLNLIILPLRSPKSAKAYRKVWTERGSPLMFHMTDVAEKVTPRMGPNWDVEIAMRYGNPSMESALDKLVERGCDPIVVMPFFPQFSNSTTGSIQAELSRIAFKRRSQPALHFVAPYYDDPGYLDAVAATAIEARKGKEVDFTVISFHGVPEKYIKKGDPYAEQCKRTAWGVVERLGLERDQWELCFQSRFGPDPWLQPYLDEFVTGIAKDKPRIQVILPGFAADCIETLEEVGLELREDFEEAGGVELIVTPCINSTPLWIDTVERLSRCAGKPGGCPVTDEAWQRRPESTTTA